MTNPFSRRVLLGLFGTGAAVVAARSPDRSASGDGHDDPGAASRDALAAAPGTGSRRVSDGSRFDGVWVWRAGDLRDRIAADPLEGIHVRHATLPPRQGAWVREWDGIHARPEWFGARADDPGTDCRPAIQAALDLCPTVQLGPGSYHVGGRLQILRNGTRLAGAGTTQTDQGDNRKSSQIVSSSATETILQIGSDSRTEPGPLVECVQLQDFSVRRAAAPFVPAQGFEGAIGIAMRWCVNCHVDRVFSIDSARGWFFYGTVENYVVRSAALRAIAGSRRDTDFFIGFHLDYSAPLAAVGGNASLYIDHCRAFGGFGKGTPELAYSAGLRTDGGWVDLYIHAFETGTLQYGIHGNGDSYGAATTYRTQDLTISNCVLDPGTVACVKLETADSSSAVQIANCYFGVGTGGTAIVLLNLAGSVSLTANQVVVAGRGGTGLSAVHVTNLRTCNNIFTRPRQPICLYWVDGFHLQDTIQALDPPGDYPAIGLGDCSRGVVDCLVTARPGSLSAMVELKGTGNRGIEVACTTLPPGPRRLVHAGQPVVAAGAFGDNCLARGIMG